MNYKKNLLFISITAMFIAVLGATFAYWRWQTAENQTTSITFTTGANFSCSADGGGTITNTNYFVPTDCTNSTYAIKRTITTSITNSGSNPVYLDMWLNVDDIDTGLSDTENFKYALTTSGTNCTTGVVSQGTFNGKQANDKIELLSEVTTANTYYLWVWLDAAETSTSTMNQSVSLSLGGECTDQAPNYTYTVNLYDENASGYNSVWIGQTIPSGITQYTSPGEAITALEAAYSSVYSGATTSLPFFLRHKIGNGTVWCVTEDGNTYCPFETQSECESANWGTCTSSVVTNGVTGSYVGFTVSQDIASANPGMTAGTYYLKGGDSGRSYNENKATLLSAFGSSYCTDNSSTFFCGVSGLFAYANSDGGVGASDADSYCNVDGGGYSFCGVDVVGGGGE